MYATRILKETDLPELEAFLLRHSDGAMIMRGNLLLAGVEDQGQRFQGPYAAAYDASGGLRAVAVHYQVANTLFAAADDEPALDAAVFAVVAESRRPVKGIIGLRPIVQRLRQVLGMQAATTQLAQDEGLYALDLATLRVPALLGDARIDRRVPTENDRALLVDWYRTYEIAGLGAKDSPDLTASVVRRFEWMLADGLRCLLTVDGVPCASTGFNARLPDCVQIGGVFTPADKRCRGYARAVVAGTLLDAREQGVKRAILFTGEHNKPAITAYRALGFQRIGDFNITLFE
jgi:predicted GNAT family acetyltransferase